MSHDLIESKILILRDVSALVRSTAPPSVKYINRIHSHFGLSRSIRVYNRIHSQLGLSRTSDAGSLQGLSFIRVCETVKVKQDHWYGLSGWEWLECVHVHMRWSGRVSDGIVLVVSPPSALRLVNFSCGGPPPPPPSVFIT